MRRKILIMMMLLSFNLTILVEGETLYYYKGPDTSEDNITLIAFQVTGSTPIEIGSYLSVSFRLINSNDGDVLLGRRGVFLAVKDPNGIERTVGCCYQNYTMQPDESISFETTLYLDRNGSWSIWPSYELKLYDPIRGWYKKVGPRYWHAYSFTVETPNKPDLVVEYIRLEPNKPVVGDNVTLLVGVKNIGTREAVDCKGRILIDSNVTYVDIPEIDVSEHIELESYWTPNEHGIHTISFLVDCYQKIDEIKENNNYLSINSTVAPHGVDLEAYQLLVYPELLMVGGNATIKPFIRNIGVNRSINCNGTIYIDDEILCNFSISPIGAGVVYRDISIHWTPKEIGVHQIKLWVDSNMIIPEEDEDNNYLTIIVNVTGEDHTPPRVNISYTPSIVTEKDNVTFHVEAFDESGVEYISIVVYSQPSMLYFGLTDSMNTSFNYTCGPFQRGDTVYYSIESRDKAGNRYRSPTYNFTVISYYSGNLTVDIYIEPSNPTEFDEFIIHAEAYYPYGIREISIINYKYNHTLIRRENTSSISFGPIGPFTSGTQLSYIAKAVDVDGHIANSKIINVTISRVGVENTRNIDAYSNSMVFLVSDDDWRTTLTLVPISVWREKNQSILSNPVFNKHVVGEEFFSYGTICIPTLVYHYEREGNLVDTKPIVNFLNNRWNASKVVIVGEPPDELLMKLVADKPVGAGLNRSQIEMIEVETSHSIRLHLPEESLLEYSNVIENRIGLNLSIIGGRYLSDSSNSTLGTSSSLWDLNSRFWREINKVVITEDDYGTALLAAGYASLVNAPLLIQGHYKLEDITGKRIFLIGEFSSVEIDEIEDYAHIDLHWNIEELQRNMIRSGMRNIILVNPLDLWVGVDLEYRSQLLGINRFYYKQSLLAPFLVVPKKAIIVETPTLNYLEVDEILQDFIDNNFSPTANPSIIILASPSSIPMAKPNWPSHPELRGDEVYFEVFNYNDIDIEKVNLTNGDSNVYSFDDNQFEPFTTKKMVGLISSNKLGEILFESMIDVFIDTRYARSPRGGLYSFVFQKKNEGTNRDIYIYIFAPISPNSKELIGSGVYTITNTSLDECNPDISEDDSIVTWQRKNETGWDICYMPITIQVGGTLYKSPKQVIRKNGNQVNPSIYGNRIVYQDDRNGNWDIYMYDISTGDEIQVTNNIGDQILPRINGDIIVWQDNRNGNWDIYMYDISNGVTTPIATTPRSEVKVDVDEKWIAWYEEGNNGLWNLWVYNVFTGRKQLVATTQVSHKDTKVLYLQVDDRFYASRNNNGYMDYPTGRVFGLTTSDLSAYIATDILFDEIRKDRRALAIIRGWSENDNWSRLENWSKFFWTDEVINEFNESYFIATYSALRSEYSNVIRRFFSYYLTIFVDHGNNNVLGGLIDSTDLINEYFSTPSFILDRACSTAAYYSTNSKHLLITTHLLRSGAMVFLGAVDLSNGHRMFDDILQTSFLDNGTIGEGYLEGRRNFSGYNDVYLLFGDPTLKPRWWS